MKRGLILLSLLFLGSMLFGCGEIDSTITTNYFPLTQGVIRQYTTLDGIGDFHGEMVFYPGIYTEETIGVIQIPGTTENATGFSVESWRYDSDPKEYVHLLTIDCYSVTSSYLKAYFNDQAYLETRLMKFPATPGETWQAIRLTDFIVITGETISLTRTVTVPAGTFKNVLEMNAIGVGTFEGGGSGEMARMLFKLYFAPDIGLIKQEKIMEIGDPLKAVQISTDELQSITRP
jgi:hypothetical protein